MNDIDILEEELRKDILYQIDMQLYDEFNDKFCEIEENLGTVYSYKDLEDLKKAESDTERTLLREAVSTLIAENKELKDSGVELATTIDSLQTDLKELKEKNKELEESLKFQKKLTKIAQIITDESLKEALEEIEEEYIPKSKVEEVIEEVKEDENPSISSFQEYAQEYAIDKLQSLLGKE